MDERFHGFQSTVENWHWWYRVRREILTQLLRTIPLPPNARLIDLGCGTGGAALVLSQFGATTGMDRAADSFALARDRPYSHRVVGDVAATLPFANDSFDVVCALDVLEHLPDDLAVARELYRICKPGGYAILFVPAFQALWGYNDDYSHHLRRYRSPELDACLMSAGFSIEKSGYFNLALFVPTLVARVLQRALPRWSEGMEHSTERSFVNEMLTHIFRAELPLLRLGARLPAGTSAFAVAKKA